LAIGASAYRAVCSAPTAINTDIINFKPITVTAELFNCRALGREMPPVPLWPPGDQVSEPPLELSVRDRARDTGAVFFARARFATWSVFSVSGAASATLES